MTDIRDHEVQTEYDVPDYPVKVTFVDRKREDALKDDFIMRPDDIELLMVNNGEVNVLCNDMPYSAKAGQGIIIENGALHRITTSSMEDTAYYSLIFRLSFVINTADDGIYDRKYKDKSAKPSCYLLDEINLNDESLIDRANNIIAANLIKKRGYELMTKGSLCFLLLGIFEKMGRKTAPFNAKNIPNQDDLRVASATQYIKDNYSDMITLSDIANHIHVSEAECCRCFKRVINMPPIEYLTRIRISEAAKMLYKDPMSVQSIQDLCFTVGFNTESYFIKLFKKYLGCTPKQFTKLLKEKPDNVIKRYDALQESVLV